MWTKRNSIRVLLSLVFLYTLLSFCFMNVAMNSDAYNNYIHNSYISFAPFLNLKFPCLYN